jgi:hypothetical protein
LTLPATKTGPPEAITLAGKSELFFGKYDAQVQRDTASLRAQRTRGVVMPEMRFNQMTKTNVGNPKLVSSWSEAERISDSKPYWQLIESRVVYGFEVPEH